MDFGIAGRKALVCGASKGLGRGCAEALAREGATVYINARSIAALTAAAEEIAKATGATVIPLAADITTEAGRDAVLAAIPDPDILVTNAGGPPTGDFREWDRDIWIKALDGNMLTPIALIKATVDGMIARKFGRIVNITSSAVKAPIDMLGLSNGARAGLTGFVAGLARKTVRHNVTINNLLPGMFATDRLLSNFAAMAKNAGLSMEEYAVQRQAGLPAGRLGDAKEFGQLCAYICSAQAGYITGQNILIDGGTYPGTF
jgi:3-oxoacyl-[acyl-carrier protein] reductase